MRRGATAQSATRGRQLTRAVGLLRVTFVAGDVRHGSIKRVASAVGEGATSIALVHSYLATLEGDRQ
jgi:hypothetical protein